MYPETRHKAIIALSFLVAVAWANFQPHAKPVEAGIVAFICAFPLLYALYYGFHVLGWVFFSGERGNGMRIIPRIWMGVTWAARSIFRTIANLILWMLRGIVFVTKAGSNAHERHQWEKSRHERERQAAEAARIEAERRETERLQAEEERQQQKIAEEEAHKRRVEREAEIAAARTKAEEAARLEMLEEANRLTREHDERMLAIEQERVALAERRAKRHDSLLGTLADLVEKSKG